MPIGVVNLKGIRSEPDFVGTMDEGRNGMRCAQPTEQVLPMVVAMLR